ncbi:MAG TPA: patatin-like phospholipase family protein [Pyrinomonadaceae bacterium]|nr:patatin-like phospholipase family protein [Pyrinomonadaceae bacterium]
MTKIGLALSGGGARGFAHVGVLKALADIKFDVITGTSAGSIVGGALASGMTIDEIEAMARKTKFRHVLRPSMSPRGLFSNARLGSFLGSHFPVATFEEAVVPFAAVSYNISTGKEAIRNSGDMLEAIRASCAVPGLFTPVLDSNGDLHVDGGVTAVMPVRLTRQMGADVVIAVDVLSCGASFRSVPRIATGVMVRSVMRLIETSLKIDRDDADLIIEPQIAHLRPDQIGKCAEFLTLGEEAGNQSREQVLKLING